ncbi:MAG: CPBP family intramembrane glutamic endopeptidase [Candidatus Nitrosocosmicus sp.]
MIKKICLKKLIDNVSKIIIFFLFLIITGSIFIGIFVVFFTNIGKDITWHSNVSLNFLLLNISGISNLQFNLGITFIFFWFIYLVVYLFFVYKPVFLFEKFKHKLISKNKFKNFTLSSSNYLYIVIQWFSGYFVLSIIVDLVQQTFGIHIGNPTMNNPLVSFLYLTAAPLNEEILFRVIFLGMPLLIILFRYKNSFISALIHPSKNISVESSRDKNILFLIIFLNSVFFGLAHVIFGGNYEIGKITQASLGGLFLGWLYYRYGLGTSIIFHWISNYVLFSYGLFGSVLFNVSWSEESNNYFLMPISIAFFIAGVIFIYKYSEKLLKFLLTNKKSV